MAQQAWGTMKAGTGTAVAFMERLPPFRVFHTFSSILRSCHFSLLSGTPQSLGTPLSANRDIFRP